MSVTLRSARLADWARLFDWRNHPSTYQYFDTPEPITLEAHLLWLDAIILEGGRLFIIEAQTRDAREHVGTIRLDAVLDQPEAKTISITIDAQARGRRYGHLALEKLIERTSRPESCVLYADIHLDNYPSLRLFASAGFQIAHVLKDRVRMIYGTPS